MNPADEDTAEFVRGAELFARLAPAGATPPWVSFGDVTPLLGRQTAIAFGAILSRPGLDLRTREIATVCMLAVLGGSEAQVTFHTGAALRAGASAPEIVEALTQVSVYAGIPRALNAAAAARMAFADHDVDGTEPAPRAVVADLLGRLGSGEPVDRVLAELIAPDVAVVVSGRSGGSWVGSPGVRRIRALCRVAGGRERLAFGEPLAAGRTVYLPGASVRVAGHEGPVDFVVEFEVTGGRIVRIRLHGGTLDDPASPAPA